MRKATIAKWIVIVSILDRGSPIGLPSWPEMTGSRTYSFLSIANWETFDKSFLLESPVWSSACQLEQYPGSFEILDSTLWLFQVWIAKAYLGNHRCSCHSSLGLRFDRRFFRILRFAFLDLDPEHKCSAKIINSLHQLLKMCIGSMRKIEIFTTTQMFAWNWNSKVGNFLESLNFFI